MVDNFAIDHVDAFRKHLDFCRKDGLRAEIPLQMGYELLDEIERLRRIEDACMPVIAPPLVLSKSVRELNEVIQANPRPS